MMRWVLLILLLPAVAWAAPTSQPVAVPYTLTDTNHILIRLKINGKGPFNFIVDTGAPAMILRIPVAQKLGLKTDDGLATIDQLDIEGGLTLKHVQCVVETPYQIEGMNAIGASGVDLDGLLGYGILAHFRMQIDLSKDRMLWTAINFNPPPLKTRTHPEPEDDSEDNLEAAGAILKFLGPLVKPIDMPAQHRGVVGIELTEKTDAVFVQHVFGNSAADRAGIKPGDRILSVNDKPIHTIVDAQAAMAKTLNNQTAAIVVDRKGAKLKLKITCGDGL